MLEGGTASIIHSLGISRAHKGTVAPACQETCSAHSKTLGDSCRACWGSQAVGHAVQWCRDKEKFITVFETRWALSGVLGGHMTAPLPPAAIPSHTHGGWLPAGFVGCWAWWVPLLKGVQEPIRPFCSGEKWFRGRCLWVAKKPGNLVQWNTCWSYLCFMSHQLREWTGLPLKRGWQEGTGTQRRRKAHRCRQEETLWRPL